MKQEQKNLPVLNKMELGELEVLINNMPTVSEKKCTFACDKTSCPCTLIKTHSGFYISFENKITLTYLGMAGDLVTKGSDFFPKKEIFIKGINRQRIAVFPDAKTLFDSFQTGNYQIS